MDGQCLVRHCLALPLRFLCLASTLSLITMLGLHVGFHGCHASHREAICTTGQAHFITLADMVIEGFVVCGPKCTHGAEVCIYSTARQLHLCPAQGVAGEKIPQAHRPRVPKVIRVTIGHVDTILALAHEHDAVYDHFLSVRHP